MGGMKVKSSLRRRAEEEEAASCLREATVTLLLVVDDPPTARAVSRSSVLLYTLPTVLTSSVGEKEVVLPVLYWCTLTKNTASAMASPPMAAAIPRRRAAGAPAVEVSRENVMGSMVMPSVRAGYCRVVVTSR